MKICVIAIGKTDNNALEELMNDYLKRLQHYVKFEFTTIPDIKNVKSLSKDQQMIKEGDYLLKKLDSQDHLVLLDERGKMYSSLEFSEFLQKKMNSGLKNLVFAIGGPYGFSEDVKRRAHGSISLSKMTFSHQMIRLFVLEQIYRGFTILKGEPYHHD